MQDLKSSILETLSFFEPMNKEQIYLQMEDHNVERVGSKTAEDLDDALSELVNEKKVRKVNVKVKEKKEPRWQKVYPKRAWWKNLKWW